MLDVIAYMAVPRINNCAWQGVVRKFSSILDRVMGISAVGADITYLTKSEFILMQQLARFQRAAEKAEVVTFLHGAQSRSLVAAAVGAGFHYVDGDAVAATLARPERIVPFQLADLYMPR